MLKNNLPASGHRLRPIPISLFALYLGVLLYASFSPATIDSHGIVWTITSEILKFTRQVSFLNWLQYNQLESLANILLYIPLGVFVYLFLTRLKLWILLIIPTLLSLTVELIQRLALPERYSTFDDVLHNGLGGLIGVLISVSMNRLKKRKSKEHSA